MPAENEFRGLLRSHLRAVRAAHYGMFDYSYRYAQEELAGGTPANTWLFVVKAGQKGTALIDIVSAPAGGSDARDFLGTTSENPPGNTASFFSVKYVMGSGKPAWSASLDAGTGSASSASATLSDADPDLEDATVVVTILPPRSAAFVAGVKIEVTNNNVPGPSAGAIDEIYFNALADYELRHRTFLDPNNPAFGVSPIIWQFNQRLT